MNNTMNWFQWIVLIVCLIWIGIQINTVSETQSRIENNTGRIISHISTVENILSDIESR